VPESSNSFRALHAGARVLVLPNVWDALSGALFRQAGAQAIATGSAAVAWACGYPDGEALPRANLLFAVNEIRRVSRGLPLSVDIESGYSNDPAEVVDLVQRLISLGVAGINLEDGGGDPGVLVAKIEAIKRSCMQAGNDIFVNARTDVYLNDLAEGEAAIRETIARLQLYERAGADGSFVPAVSEADAIRSIARAIKRPLNVLAMPGLGKASALYELGVRRLSAGPGLAKLAYGTAREAAMAFLRDGNSSNLSSPRALDFSQTNALFEGL